MKKLLVNVSLQNATTGEVIHTQRDESCVWQYNVKGQLLTECGLQRNGWYEIPKSSADK